MRIPSKTADPVITQAIEQVDQLGVELVEEVVRVASVAAPTSREHERGAYVRSQFSSVGLESVTQDAIGNVRGVIRGESQRRTFLVTAHMDTVFDADVNTIPTQDGNVLRGPGVRDNSAAVAALIQVARLLVPLKWRPPYDVVLAATVGEEGTGDLAGIRYLVKSIGTQLGGVLVVDGYLGSVVHTSVGSTRLKARFVGNGGHSWQDRGCPSAVHALGVAISKIAALAHGRPPSVALNVGTVKGGTGVNVIANDGSMEIDIRAVNDVVLRSYVEKVRQICSKSADAEGCKCKVEEIGQRPAGSLPKGHPYVTTACNVLESLGIRPTLEEGSTEANVPASRGIPAIAIGASSGSGVHTLSEHLLVDSLPAGLKQIVLVVGALAHLPEGSSCV